MNRFEKSWDTLVKRVLKHWQTTAKGIIYGVLLFMYYEGKIDTQQWIMATGSILAFNSIFLQKDPGKIANKPEVKDENL